MKALIRYLLVCFITLSPALCRAGVIVERQNFDDMYKASPKELVDSNSGQTGTTDFVTYTCSGGAKFYFDKAKTDNDIAIFLESSNDQQVVTSQIQNLDSIVVRYVSKSTEKRISVAYSTNGVDGWVELTTQQIDGVIAKGVKMPQVGDYYLRFMRFRDDVYIKQIDYFCLDPLSGCPNCFIYKP